MDLDAVAVELYALEPAGFTTARTEREKQARADGDKELARQIHQLRKPTVTAWLANLLARERPDSLRPLTELGTQLQEAQQTLQGDALRQLARQRHQLVYALVQEARELAAAAGQKVTEQVARELEQTLQATLADPAAAEAVLAGRLTTAVQHSGFGPQVSSPPSRSAPSAAATKSEPAKTAKTAKATRAERSKKSQAESESDAVARRHEAARAAAQRHVEDAEEALQAADATMQTTEDAAADLEQRQEDLRARIVDLQRSLTEAEEELTGVRREARRAHRDLDRAAQARDRALRSLTQAQAALQGLPDPD